LTFFCRGKDSLWTPDFEPRVVFSE